MNISHFMGAQLVQLQHTLSLSLLDMAQATQAAGATVMLEEFAKTQASVQQAISAPHPTLGTVIDIRV
jgi:hypothetical protein